MAGIMRQIRDECGAARRVRNAEPGPQPPAHPPGTHGGDADDGLRSLDLDLSQKNLCHIVADKDAERVAAPTTPQSIRVICPPRCGRCWLPRVAAHDVAVRPRKPLGLLYGDGGQLGEAGYHRFRALCREACEGPGGGAGNAAAAGKPLTAPS